MQAGLLGGTASTAEHAEVLSAMLRLAEGEIRGKDEQIALLHQMVATNEQEIHKKDVRIDELNNELSSLRAEIEQFKSLFDKYLQKAEAARSTSAFSRAPATSSDQNGHDGNPIRNSDYAPGGALQLLPPSSAALVTQDAMLHLSPGGHRSPISRRRPLLADDDMLPPPPSEDAPFASLDSVNEAV